LVLLLVVALLGLVLAALIGILYGYAHRSPAAMSATFEPPVGPVPGTTAPGSPS
jgi:hypothetical protein